MVVAVLAKQEGSEITTFKSSQEHMELSNFILGFLCTSSLLLLWFYSSLKTTLAKILFKEQITNNDQFEDLIVIRWKSENLSHLSSCYICMSFWTSLVVGCGMTLLGSPNYMPLITFFTYPCLCYAMKKYVFD